MNKPITDTSKQAYKSGHIGRIYGVKIYETQTFIRPKPSWFPSNWLWYTMTEWFTVQEIKPYIPATPTEKDS